MKDCLVTKKDQQNSTSWDQSHTSYLHNHVKTKIFYTGIFKGWLISLYINEPIWADTVAGEDSVSQKFLHRKFSFLHDYVGMMCGFDPMKSDFVDLFL